MPDEWKRYKHFRRMLCFTRPSVRKVWIDNDLFFLCYPLSNLLVLAKADDPFGVHRLADQQSEEVLADVELFKIPLKGLESLRCQLQECYMLQRLRTKPVPA